jgi:hypothetical protein
MTCQHPRPTFRGILGDLIDAVCSTCGHRWRIRDYWMSHGNHTALERHEAGCCAIVRQGA